MDFTNRKKIILQEVIVRFIKDAEPVSSGKIAASLNLDISSATIRKEMYELEEMGYLTHPHTSSGRVPTDRGYRFYVDNITESNLNPIVKKEQDLPGIRDMITKSMEIEAVLKESTEMLAKITNYLSMIVAPTIDQSKFKHLELLKFEGENYLMVLITDTGRVYKRSFSLEGRFTDLDLQGAAGILNSELRDKNFLDIEADNIRVSDGDIHLILLINRIIELIKECMGENLAHNRIFIHGASVIMQQPEFVDIKNIHQIISVIENEYLLMKMLMDFSKDKSFMVKIGAELFSEGSDNLSLIASKYRIKGNTSGAIGILGPKRMDYSRVINIMNIFRKNLTEVFDSRA
ncbi:MAG: heat-inducible transcriptional repressor HrcA [Candidatus Humimicrobiaceae bacterium]